MMIAQLFRAMVERHISVPKTFADGDVLEWFQSFEVCGKANQWDAPMKALNVEQIQEQIEKLMGQVAALSTASLRTADTQQGQFLC